MTAVARGLPVRLLSGFALSLLVMGCSLGALNGIKGKKYLIVDHSTGRILTSIVMAPNSTRPARIVSYGPNQRITREQQLTYDNQGRLVSRDITVNLQGGGTVSSRITYSYKDVLGPSGRLEKTIQYASNGKVVTTTYGYDSSGKARGVVVANGSALVMKDYQN